MQITAGLQQLYTIKQIKGVKHQMIQSYTFESDVSVNEHKSHIPYAVRASTTIIWKQHRQKTYDG